VEGGDYVIIVKGNQPQLHQEIEEVFQDPTVLLVPSAVRQHSPGDGDIPQYHQRFEALGWGDEYRRGLSLLCSAAVGGFSPNWDQSGQFRGPKGGVSDLYFHSNVCHADLRFLKGRSTALIPVYNRG
jgi:hypothetical protein